MDKIRDTKLNIVAQLSTAAAKIPGTCPVVEPPNCEQVCSSNNSADTLLGWAVVLLAAALAYALSELMSIRNAEKAATRDASTQCSEDAETLRASAAMRALVRMLKERGLSDRVMPEETRLLQTLQATQMNVQIACERLLATEKWRAERALMQEGSNLNSSLHGGGRAASPPRALVHGHDLQGRSCLHVRLGDSPSTLPDEVLAVIDAHFDRQRRALASTASDGGDSISSDGGHLTSNAQKQQLCVIMDMADLDFKTMLRPPIGTGVELVKQLRAHYPQRMAHLHIVHAPAVARWLVSTVCSVVDSRTAKKIHVHDATGARLASALSDYFAIEELPQAYGGTLPAYRVPTKEQPAQPTPQKKGKTQRAAQTPQGMRMPPEVLTPHMVWGGEPRDTTPSGRAKGGTPNGHATTNGDHGNGNSNGATDGLRAKADGPGEGARTPAAGKVPEVSHKASPKASAAPRPSMDAEATGDGGAKAPSGPRHVWSVLSEREAAEVRKLREAGLADAEIRAEPYADLDDAECWPDDELVRFLCDTTPPYNQTEGLASVRAAAKMRATLLARPIPGEALAAMHHAVRFDGTTKAGERALFLCMSRPLQDALLKDPEPFLQAIIGLMANARSECFLAGQMETVQTVVMVERGFALKLPVAAGQRVMTVITTLWPSITSKILVVNLPGYLSWFVGFVKGFLCEASQQKIELINEFDRLLDFYERDQLPSYFRERGSITP